MICGIPGGTLRKMPKTTNNYIHMNCITKAYQEYKIKQNAEKSYNNKYKNSKKNSIFNKIFDIFKLKVAIL